MIYIIRARITIFCLMLCCTHPKKWHIRLRLSQSSKRSFRFLSQSSFSRAQQLLVWIHEHWFCPKYYESYEFVSIDWSENCVYLLSWMSFSQSVGCQTQKCPEVKSIRELRIESLQDISHKLIMSCESKADECISELDRVYYSTSVAIKDVECIFNLSDLVVCDFVWYVVLRLPDLRCLWGLWCLFCWDLLNGLFIRHTVLSKYYD